MVDYDSPVRFFSGASDASPFDVDVLSIYRHERDKVLPILWDYALKGVEAEAANPAARQILRAFRSDLDRPNVIVQGLEARGRRLVAVRMVGAMRDSVRTDRLKKNSAPNARLAKPSWLICQSRDPRAIRPANTFWAGQLAFPQGVSHRARVVPGHLMGQCTSREVPIPRAQRRQYLQLFNPAKADGRGDPQATPLNRTRSDTLPQNSQPEPPTAASAAGAPAVENLFWSQSSSRRGAILV